MNKQIERYRGLLDFIDGGGAGGRGGTFEGGGLLSLLANGLARPYGSEDGERGRQRDAFYAQFQRPPVAPDRSGRPPVPRLPAAPPTASYASPAVGYDEVLPQTRRFAAPPPVETPFARLLRELQAGGL